MLDGFGKLFLCGCCARFYGRGKFIWSVEKLLGDFKSGCEFANNVSG